MSASPKRGAKKRIGQITIDGERWNVVFERDQARLAFYKSHHRQHHHLSLRHAHAAAVGEMFPFNTQPLSITTDVKTCSCCGESHVGLVFVPLTKPVGKAGWTHSAPCPKTLVTVFLKKFTQ